jgi:hypothetical protein
MRTALGLCLAGFVWAAMASLFFTFADTYSGSSCTAVPEGATSCTDTSSTFLAVNGTSAAILLVIPLLLAGATFALLSRRAEAARTLALAPAIALLLACGVAVFSIGLLYLPAALLCLAATIIDRRALDRPAAQPTGRGPER